jgi:phenylpyruvate tautomerase PptA (4-oxalocrotonate tautomerase family)
MPLVTIETRRGLPPATKHALKAAVHDALVAAFKIPDHDRTQRFVEHAPEDFDVPPGRGARFTLVTITAFPGRSPEAKRALYREIAARAAAAGVPAADVFVVLQEPPMENWSLRDGAPVDKAALGFKVEV